MKHFKIHYLWSKYRGRNTLCGLHIEPADYVSGDWMKVTCKTCLRLIAEARE